MSVMIAGKSGGFIKLISLLGSFLFTLSGSAQNLPFFKPLRYDEDYSFLRSDSNLTGYKRVKFIPLSKDRRRYFSLGGELRTRMTVGKNEKWGDAPVREDVFWLSRILLHSDWHVARNTRIFFQLQSAFVNGRNSLMSTSPAEHNKLDVHQFFIDVSLLKNRDRLIMRLGRQELTLGSLRLVAVRDFPNARRSFDGGRVLFKHKSLASSVFYTLAVGENRGTFDDKLFSSAIKLGGSYNTLSNVRFIQNFDLYYLVIEKEMAVWNDASGRERRSSLGARIFGNSGKWTFDFEGLYQLGSIGNKKIRGAWSVSCNNSFLLAASKFQPRAGLKTELVSGDRKVNDHLIQSLNPYFPNGGYFGLPGVIGPSNLFDIHPSFSIKPVVKIGVGLDFDIFWRFSQNDGIYGPAPNIIYPASHINDLSIGKQLVLEMNYAPNSFTNFLVNAIWFWPGPFIRKSGAGKTIMVLCLIGQIKF